MRGLAAFVMAGRWQAVLVAVGFGLLAFFLAPFSILSAAAVALITLRKGGGEGAWIIALGGLVYAVLGTLLMGQPLVGAAYALMQWGPVYLLAWLLRRSVSWAWTLQAAAAVGAFIVLVVLLGVPDIEAIWREALGVLFKTAFEQSGLSEEEITAILARAAHWMTGGLVAFTALLALLSLILARAWQAALFNPGGFGEEFRALRAGYWPAGVMLGFMLAAPLLDWPVLGAMALAIAPICFIQGVAAMHGISRALGWPTGLLVGMYVVLLLPPTMPYALAFLTAFGVIDAFADVRRKLPAKRGGE